MKHISPHHSNQSELGPSRFPLPGYKRLRTSSSSFHQQPLPLFNPPLFTFTHYHYHYHPNLPLHFKMIFPSFSTFIPAILAFGSIVSSAAPAPSPAGLGDLLSGLTGGLGGLGGSVPSTGGATDALDIVQTLKDTTVSFLSFPRPICLDDEADSFLLASFFSGIPPRANHFPFSRRRRTHSGWRSRYPHPAHFRCESFTSLFSFFSRRSSLLSPSVSFSDHLCHWCC